MHAIGFPYAAAVLQVTPSTPLTTRRLARPHMPHKGVKRRKRPLRRALEPNNMNLLTIYPIYQYTVQGILIDQTDNTMRHAFVDNRCHTPPSSSPSVSRTPPNQADRTAYPGPKPIADSAVPDALHGRFSRFEAHQGRCGERRRSAETDIRTRSTLDDHDHEMRGRQRAGGRQSPGVQLMIRGSRQALQALAKVRPQGAMMHWTRAGSKRPQTASPSSGQEAT